MRNENNENKPRKRKPKVPYYLRRLAELRGDAELTQNDVAKILGISRPTYAEYETGATAIPIYHLHVLANLYNVSIDFILGRSDDSTILKPGNPMKTNEYANSIVQERIIAAEKIKQEIDKEKLKKMNQKK